MFETNESGFLYYDELWKVSGPNLFKQDNGDYAIPIGCITIQETLAPEGYTLNPEMTTVHFTLQQDGTVSADKSIWNTTNECEDLTVDSAEAPIRGDLKFIKKDESGKPMANVKFSITDKNTGESHVIWTDENGLATTEASVHPHTVNTNKGIDASSGIWFGDGDADDTKGALLFGEYVITELECEANKGYKLAKAVEVTISENGTLINLDNIVNKKMSLATQAFGTATGDKVVENIKEASVTDTVSYKALDEGKEYTLKASLVDKASKDVVASAEKTFTAESENGAVNVEFTNADLSALGGHTLVVTEKLYDGETLVMSHESLDDPEQTVYVPKIGTTAVDGQTQTHTGNVGQTTIVDTVSYSNLVTGKEYTVKGVLMDKTTGEELLVNGQKVTAEKTFTAETKDGSVEITFSLDASALAGTTVVVFEDLLHNDIEVATHSDITDKDQTVDYPDLHTTAEDEKTGGNVGSMESSTLIDTVAYSNLIVGKDYTVKGVLMDKATGKELLVNGQKVTAETTFTATEKSGTVELVYTIDASVLAGKTVVVFEDLYNEGIKVTSHADIDDEDQSVSYPDVHTSAADGETKTSVGVAGKTTIVDTVTYSNLVVGKEYTVKGILMDKESGKELRVDGKTIAAEATFTAETADGTIDLTYELDASTLAGKSTVVFEDLFFEDVKVASHAEIDDEGQTVEYPGIRTTAADSHTGDGTGTVESHAQIVDTVTYKNLIIGKEYTVKGTLMDKATGKELLVNGEKVTAETTFTAETKDGSVDLIYYLDSSALAGKTVVVFEDLYNEDVKVTSHADLEDEDQTIHYPDVHTSAKDGQTNDNVGTVGQTTIIDTVSYSNLVVGKEYTVSGILMDKDTKEALLVSGEEVTAEVTFTAEKANGTIDLIYTLDSSLLTGKTTVVFEDLIHNDVRVAAHTDINDEDQTVEFPEIHTTATDGTTDSKQSVTGKTTIIDTVEYKNLVIGKEYTVSGVLMNKETGEPVLVDGEEVTAETTFTAESKDGNIDLVYELDASALAGTTIVVFEDLYHAEVKVTSHADIEDEEQTVFVPKVGTTATVNGAKTVKEGKTVTLTDKVAYENLIPGEEYTLKGWIVNKTTGKEMDITAELTFTPEEANGTVDVEFTINTKGLADNELVVFEEIYMGETFISDHKDIDDEGQTVKVVKNPGTIITRTGDSTRITLLCITLAAALTVLVIAAKAKKAQNR